MGAQRVCWPCLDAVLNGSLACREVILYGFTSVFAHAEYIALDSGLVLSPAELAITASKAAGSEAVMILDGKVPEAALLKLLSDLECELWLGASVDILAQKFAAGQVEIGWSADAESSAGKALADALDGMCLSGNLSEVITTLIQRVTVTIILDGSVDEMRLLKDAGSSAAALSLGTDGASTLAKPVLPGAADLMIASSLEVEAVRVRKLGDLAGLTLGDLSAWTMREFYYKEE